MNPTTAFSSERPSELRSAAVIKQIRAALDWMIAHPDWEGSIALAIARLGYKGQRQGITFRQAALSLSIEEKCAALRHALKEGLPKPRETEARKLAALWGHLDSYPDSGRSRPSESRWSDFSRQILLLIASRYQEYKTAQLSLYQTHACLAAREARLCARRLCQRDDAAQEGRMALLQAIDRIDPSKPFAPYARQWIRRRIQNFLMQQSVPVRAPINLVSRAHQQRNSLCDDASRRPTPLLDLSPDGIVRLDDDRAPEHFMPDETADAPNESAIKREERQLLLKAITTLTKPQRQALTLRYGLDDDSQPLSLAAVASEFGISRQQVFQREKRAIHALSRILSDLHLTRHSPMLSANAKYRATQTS